MTHLNARNTMRGTGDEMSAKALVRREPVHGQANVRRQRKCANLNDNGKS